jgi:hypothetical protein
MVSRDREGQVSNRNSRTNLVVKKMQSYSSFDSRPVMDVPFDEETLEKMRSCTKAEFPICLSEGLLRMFGAMGKKRLDSIVMNETFENTPVCSPKDIWKLYEKYMERTANILGDDVVQVIEFESLDLMKSMLCQKCPMYEMELERSVRSGNRMLACRDIFSP